MGVWSLCDAISGCSAGGTEAVVWHVVREMRGRGGGMSVAPWR